VSEIIEAFTTYNEQESLKKSMDLPRIEKSAGPKIVVACLSGKRATLLLRKRFSKSISKKFGISK